jgi:hypothetical protein
VIAAGAIFELAVLNRGAELALGVLGDLWSRGRLAEFASARTSLVRADVPWIIGGTLVFLSGSWLLGSLVSLKFEWTVVVATGLAIQTGWS